MEYYMETLLQVRKKAKDNVTEKISSKEKTK